MVEASELTTISLGDSRGLRPGQWVLALGFSGGVVASAAAGVVLGESTPDFEAAARDVIPIGLRLKPGYSGGPLLDAEGRLVGINTMVVGTDVGIAIPVHTVKTFLKSVLAPA